MTLSHVEETRERPQRVTRQSHQWYPSGSRLKHCCAEFLGSLMLHFLSLAAFINGADPTLNGTNWADHHGKSGNLIAALGTGFSFAVLLYCTAGENGSGGRLNPILSTALFVARRISNETFAAELIMQFAGGCVATMAVVMSLPGSAMLFPAGEGPVFHMEGVEDLGLLLRTMLMHFILASALTLIYLSTAVDFHNKAYTHLFWPLAVGFSASTGILAGGRFSWAWWNPALGVSAAVCFFNYQNLWAYLASVFLGAVAASALYTKLGSGGVGAPPFKEGLVFEGVRQERQEFSNQSFVAYLVIDQLESNILDEFETRFRGRLCYPEVSEEIAKIEGFVTQDGKVLCFDEEDGPFPGSSFSGYLPDTRHVIGRQFHKNGVCLANLCLSLTGSELAEMVQAQLRVKTKKEPMIHLV